MMETRDVWRRRAESNTCAKTSGDICVAKLYRVDIMPGNWREIVKKNISRERDRSGIVDAYIVGARRSCRNIRTGQNPRPITNTRRLTELSVINPRNIFLWVNWTILRVVGHRVNRARMGWVFAVTRGFQWLTGKSSDERLTRFSRYSSAIKLPSTIPSAIKLVRGDTKPSERLRPGPWIIQ